jgi:tol-pal system protein YbgF
MAVSPPDSQSAFNAEIRFGQVDDQIRSLTGQIEEINYNLDQLKRRLDKLVNDVDQRLSALEHGGAQTAAAGEAAAAPSVPPPAPTGVLRPPRGQPTPPPGAGANPSEPASASGVLGSLPANPPAAAQQAAAGNLPSGTAQEQYNYAFGLLRQTDYPAAEQALRAFIQRYPNDPLAANAQYWLGETYYVRKDYNGAAAAFAEGYQKYPKGGKAPDSLLKLGMALGNLGQKADACRAFARLDRDFPSAPANIKERASSEKQRLSCG